MRKIIGGVAIALTVLTGAFVVYHWRNRPTYGPERVVVRAVGLQNDGLALHFRPPREEGYYCPGVRMERDGTTIRYKYARSRIGSRRQVDIVAWKDQNGDLAVTFPFPEGRWETGDHIELFDSSGKAQAKMACVSTCRG